MSEFDPRTWPRLEQYALAAMGLLGAATGGLVGLSVTWLFGSALVVTVAVVVLGAVVVGLFVAGVSVAARGLVES